LDCAMTTAWDNQIVLQAFFDERTPRWRLGQVDYPRERGAQYAHHGLPLPRLRQNG
jgi:hypothetical protein